MQSTRDCSGNWALELGYRTESSVAPLPKMCTILVSAEELAHNKESGSPSAVREGRSARAILIPPEDVKENLEIKTRIVSLDPHPQQPAAKYELGGL